VGEEQESGVRSQESEVRSQNEEHLLSAFCLLLTAYCLLRLREFELAGLLDPAEVYDNMSPPTGKEKTSNVKN
jgi:hypothetical protein